MSIGWWMPFISNSRMISTGLTWCPLLCSVRIFATRASSLSRSPLVIKIVKFGTSCERNFKRSTSCAIKPYVLFTSMQ